MNRISMNLNSEQKLVTIVSVFLAAWMLVYGSEPYQKYLKNKCWWCGKSSIRRVIYHIKPQHFHPELSQVESNCITLCDPILLRSSGCHYKIGHRGISWKYDNSKMMEVIIEHERKENKVD